MALKRELEIKTLAHQEKESLIRASGYRDIRRASLVLHRRLEDGDSSFRHQVHGLLRREQGSLLRPM